MSAWQKIQTRPLPDIVAEVFEQMGGRSNSDPRSPWADLALALCERCTAAEAKVTRLRTLLRMAHPDYDNGNRDLRRCDMCVAIDAGEAAPRSPSDAAPGKET